MCSFLKNPTNKNLENEYRAYKNKLTAIIQKAKNFI